jgi:hypothetical protein
MNRFFLFNKRLWMISGVLAVLGLLSRAGTCGSAWSQDSSWP